MSSTAFQFLSASSPAAGLNRAVCNSFPLIAPSERTMVIPRQIHFTLPDLAVVCELLIERRPLSDTDLVWWLLLLLLSRKQDKPSWKSSWMRYWSSGPTLCCLKYLSGRREVYTDSTTHFARTYRGDSSV